MTYRLLTGQFVIRYPEAPDAGPEPDGDTVKFVPDDPTLVEEIGHASGVQPDFSRLHRISQRLEGLDALETHFQGSHQELGLARQARDHLLAFLGFRDVTFDPARPERVKSANADQLPGWVLCNGIENNGRMVSFVFTGPPPFTNGAQVFLDDALLARSLNLDLLARGLAYPLLYSSLPAELRASMAGAAAKARADGAGLWPASTADPDGAATLSGGIDALEQLVIWPKLYRRLVTFYSGGGRDLARFDAWLRANPRERDDTLLLLDTGELGNLHDVVSASTGSVRLNRWPETFVVLPSSAAVPTPPPGPMPVTSVTARLISALVNPKGEDAGQETVSLLNAGSGPLDLTGWTLTGARGGVERLDGAIPAGDVRRVTLRSLRLVNTGDTILLKDTTGAVIDRAVYTAKQVPAPGVSVVFQR